MFKTVVFIIVFLFGSVSCNAQEVILPLNTSYMDLPNNAYVKDLENELDQYVGVYKAQFQGKETTLYFEKEVKKQASALKGYYYTDQLNVKFVVKDSTGKVLIDSRNSAGWLNKLVSSFKLSRLNVLSFIYSGTNCGVGNGSVLLRKLDATHINWTYSPNSSLLLEEDCPKSLDLTVYLPVTEDLVFTKVP